MDLGPSQPQLAPEVPPRDLPCPRAPHPPRGDAAAPSSPTSSPGATGRLRPPSCPHGAPRLTKYLPGLPKKGLFSLENPTRPTAAQVLGAFPKGQIPRHPGRAQQRNHPRHPRGREDPGVTGSSTPKPPSWTSLGCPARSHHHPMEQRANHGFWDFGTQIGTPVGTSGALSMPPSPGGGHTGRAGCPWLRVQLNANLIRENTLACPCRGPGEGHAPMGPLRSLLTLRRRSARPRLPPAI